MLVVDDDETIRKFVRTALEKRGWTVLEAEDGVDGTARCILHSPDVLLTDISMPKGDGLEMLEVLRAGVFLDDVHVVIMSGVLGVDDSKLKNTPAAAFLSKPFSLQGLYTAVGA